MSWWRRNISVPEDFKQGIRDIKEGKVVDLEKALTEKPELVMTEVELNAAFRLGKGEPIWVALMQILDAHKLDAVTNAAGAAGSPSVNLALCELGGWDALNAIQEELIQRRESGLRS